ncbi:ubiquitin carboxyl-terminal hydrolase [Mycena galopus ATCC 62051]|nr:ubiquitin carboxyl-terminal hydrolase [Mycena galopus ATCC 62051]
MNPTTSPIFDEKLDIGLAELKTMRALTVVWTGSNNQDSEETTLAILLRKTTTIENLANHISGLVTLKPGGSGRIRVFASSTTRTSQLVFTGPLMIGNIPDSATVYAEEVPLEEVQAGLEEQAIPAFHFSQRFSQTYGVPFTFVVKKGEIFSDTRRRLQSRLGATDEEMRRTRFALVRRDQFTPTYIVEDDILYGEHFSVEEIVGLGVDHTPRSGNTVRPAAMGPI